MKLKKQYTLSLKLELAEFIEAYKKETGKNYIDIFVEALEDLKVKRS